MGVRNALCNRRSFPLLTNDSSAQCPMQGRKCSAEPKNGAGPKQRPQRKGTARKWSAISIRSSLPRARGETVATGEVLRPSPNPTPEGGPKAGEGAAGASAPESPLCPSLANGGRGSGRAEPSPVAVPRRIAPGRSGASESNRRRARSGRRTRPSNFVRNHQN